MSHKGVVPALILGSQPLTPTDGGWSLLTLGF